MQISVESLPGRRVAQWERLMALHTHPGADLKGPRVRRPLGPGRRRLSRYVQGRRGGVAP
jgi:hypothetical protein